MYLRAPGKMALWAVWPVVSLGPPPPLPGRAQPGPPLASQAGQSGLTATPEEVGGGPQISVPARRRFHFADEETG